MKTTKIYHSRTVCFDPRVKCKPVRGIYGLHVLHTILHKYPFSLLGISGGLENRIQGFLHQQEPIGQKFSVLTLDEVVIFVKQLGRGQDEDFVFVFLRILPE